jgi:hypothetical protein
VCFGQAVQLCLIFTWYVFDVIVFTKGNDQLEKSFHGDILHRFSTLWLKEKCRKEKHRKLKVSRNWRFKTQNLGVLHYLLPSSPSPSPFLTPTLTLTLPHPYPHPHPSSPPPSPSPFLTPTLTLTITVVIILPHPHPSHV